MAEFGREGRAACGDDTVVGDRARKRLRQVACALLALWSVIYSVAGVRRIAERSRSRSWIVWHQARLAGLRQLLDPATAVGYVGDRERTLQSVIAFPLTQYAVAPVLVENSQLPVLVIGDFPAGAPAPAELDRLRLRVDRDLGDGLLLLRHQASP